MSEWTDNDKPRIRNYLGLPPGALSQIQSRMDSLTNFDAEGGTDIVGEVQSALSELDALTNAMNTLDGAAAEISSESISVSGEYSRSITYDSRWSTTARRNSKEANLINKIARDLGIVQQLSIGYLCRS